MDDLGKLAVQAALEGNWQQAIELNKQIVSSLPDNIQALNRLAFAYLQSGQMQQAKEIYEQVLEQEPDHPIAAKNLPKTLQSGSKQTPNRLTEKAQSDPVVFIKEPGTTRQTVLINTAKQSILNSLQVGQEVKLILKKNTVRVRTMEDNYIGALPDDIAFLLKNLIEKGNSYRIHIISTDIKRVCVFIREVKRGATVGQATFHHSILSKR